MDADRPKRGECKGETSWLDTLSRLQAVPSRKRQIVPEGRSLLRQMPHGQGRRAGPGQHGARRAGKPTEYAKRLREKQKARRISGVLERQFRRLFASAAHASGNTGENLLRLLETRLDNVVRRLVRHLAARGPSARPHNHVTVNGKSVNIASYQVKPGDRWPARRPARQSFHQALLHAASQRGLPAWLSNGTAASPPPSRGRWIPSA